MKSILDPDTRTEILYRIDMISENSQALWGKMNVYQMLKHCTLDEEMYQSQKKY